MKKLFSEIPYIGGKKLILKRIKDEDRGFEKLTPAGKRVR